MRRYLIDTSVLAAYLFNRQTITDLLTPWITDRQAATTILVYGEIIEYLRERAKATIEDQAEKIRIRNARGPASITKRVLTRRAKAGGYNGTQPRDTANGRFS